MYWVNLAFDMMQATSARASFGCYNTEGDVAALVRALEKAHRVLG